MKRGATYERQDRDFYPTPTWVFQAVLKHVRFSNAIWECASGNGLPASFLQAEGYTVYRSDIHPIADPDARMLDFLNEPCPWPVKLDIVTNPPYGAGNRMAEAFIRRAFEYAKPNGTKIAMLLPVDFDSAATRTDMFRDCPAYWGQIVLLDRIKWFNTPGTRNSPSANHAWFVWDWSTSQFPRKAYSKR